jgi:xanthine dehydrogenase accessory factor
VLNYVLIKGAGDLASGVALTLVKAGFKVVMTEIPQPTCVRRMVSFAEAVYDEEITIDGIRGRKAGDFREALEIAGREEVAVLVDPQGETLDNYPPLIYIDAAMTKRNMGTCIDAAGIVLALGPGYEAGVDAHAVIETARGDGMGKPLYTGSALPNTSIPGDVMGYTTERVLRSPAQGIFTAELEIGEAVNKGDIVGYVSEAPVKAAINGTVRGLLKSGLNVRRGAKLGDIHPEVDREIIFTVTDKARAIGRGALQAISALQEKGIPDTRLLNRLIYRRLLEEVEGGRPSILYTLVKPLDYYNVRAGSHLLVLSTGYAYGSLGLPSLDKEIAAHAERLFSQTDVSADLLRVKLPEQKGGLALIMERPFFPDKNLVIFGAGHVAIPLAEMGSIMGYRTVVVDDRRELLTRERFPRAERLICAPFEDVFNNDQLKAEINAMTSIVIVTRGHAFDLLCLKNALRFPVRYIGMIGSKNKVKNTFSRLLDEGVSRETLEKVSAPLGLDLGGKKPEHVALSVMAQLLALENGGTGKPLNQMLKNELFPVSYQRAALSEQQ